MPVLGLHCSHDQVHPSALLAACQRAEAAGCDAATSSDHFSPWSARQGHSAFAWSWPGAALQATSLPFGVVDAPGQYLELDFDKIMLHHVGREQDAFGAKVLPQLRSAA